MQHPVTKERMVRRQIFHNTYRPRFSGHETFPLRYGWLKKAFDRVLETEYLSDNRSACWGEDAIARFGVGKNMVASMRHWAKVTGVIEESNAQSVRTTEFGRMLFGPRGLDLYMEHPATLWLIHWRLASREEMTTWYWTFNFYPAVTFDRATLIRRLDRLAIDCNWSRVANTTIRNDVACFIRNYVARQPSAKSGHDDVLESPLTELGLIKAVGHKDGYRFVRGPKATLGDGVFIFALLDFWSRYSSASTLSFEAIAYAPGGPGRVFLLDENDVADRLTTIDTATNGSLIWSETAGLKQVERRMNFDDESVRSWIRNDYKTLPAMDAA